MNIHCLPAAEISNKPSLPARCAAHGPADFTPWLKALADIRYQGFINPFLHGHPTPDELSAGMMKSSTYLKDCQARAL